MVWGSEGFINGCNAQVKTSFETLNDRGVFRPEGQASELVGPGTVNIWECGLKLFLLEDKSGRHAQISCSLSTYGIESGVCFGSWWGVASRNTG